MTKPIPKKTAKKATMTENEIKYGCLSKSLENFLLLSEKERDQKYGKKKYKYYQRIVNEVQDSFRDIVLSYARLPPEYSKKIDLRLGLSLIRTEIMKQQSAKDRANFSISQASQALSFVLNDLAYPDQVTKLIRDEFDKVQNWLVVLNQFDPELKKEKQ